MSKSHRDRASPVHQMPCCALGFCDYLLPPRNGSFKDQGLCLMLNFSLPLPLTLLFDFWPPFCALFTLCSCLKPFHGSLLPSE